MDRISEDIEDIGVLSNDARLHTSCRLPYSLIDKRRLSSVT